MHFSITAYSTQEDHQANPDLTQSSSGQEFPCICLPHSLHNPQLLVWCPVVHLALTSSIAMEVASPQVRSSWAQCRASEPPKTGWKAAGRGAVV